MTAQLVESNVPEKTIVSPAPVAPKPVAQPNEEQQNAIDLFLDWFNDKNADPLFELQGSAGVGKSWTLAQMLKAAELRYADVILAAPCNKAAFVLQQALFEAGLPRFECKTIHSALGIKIADYDEKGQPIFDTKKGNRKNIENLKLLIIDEKSMIDRNLYESIHTLAPDGLKILLCGDSFQLPPVVKTVPLILSHEEYDRSSVSGFTDPFSLSPAIGCAIPEQSATLQRIMRQDGGCCVELLKSIRSTISEADEFMRQLHQDPNGQWTFTPSLSLFQEERDHSLQEYETKSAFLRKSIELFREQKRAKVIAYKNSTVNYFQSQIFKSLFPDTETPYPVGLYIQLKEHWRNGGSTIVVPAGCEGYVTEATLQKAYFAGTEIEYHNLAVDFGELFGTVNLKVPTAESAVHIKNAIDVIQATMQRDSGVEYTPDMSLKSLYTQCKLDIEIDSMPTLAQAIGFSHGNIAKEQGTIVFQLMQMSMIKTSWKQGWSFVYSLKSSFAEVENGFCSTVYKAQGSTYSEVMFYNDMPRFQINPWQLDRNAIDLLKVKGKIDAAKKSLKSKRGQTEESFKALVRHEFEQFLSTGTVPKDWDFEEWQTAIEFKLNELIDVNQYLEAYTRKTQGMDPRVCLRALYVAASRHKASLHFFDAAKDFD